MEFSHYLCNRKSQASHTNRLQGQAPLEYRPKEKERVFYRHTEISYAAMRRT